VAEVIFEAARVAREESKRLRSDTAVLKFAMRSRTRTAEERTAQAEAAAASLNARRATPVTSPWSGLRWLFEDESLDRALVPLD
jgi:hypothetical protein